MSNKNFAVGTAIVLFVIIAVWFFSQAYLAFGGINPIAAVGALTVAVVGVAWLKKTAKTI